MVVKWASVRMPTEWRRRWDSNPRCPFRGHARFRVEAVITTSILLHIEFLGAAGGLYSSHRGVRKVLERFLFQGLESGKLPCISGFWAPGFGNRTPDFESRPL